MDKAKIDRINELGRIAKERELWKDSYFDKVYADVDSVLVSLIYKREHRVSPYTIFPFGYYPI